MSSVSLFYSMRPGTDVLFSLKLPSPPCFDQAQGSHQGCSRSRFLPTLTPPVINPAVIHQ